MVGTGLLVFLSRSCFLSQALAGLGRWSSTFAYFPVSKYLRTSSHIQSLPNCLFFSVVFKPFLVTFPGCLAPSWTLPTTLTCKPAPSVLTSPEPSLLDLILLSSLPVNLRLTASPETQEFRFCQCPLS